MKHKQVKIFAELNNFNFYDTREHIIPDDVA